ncbi:developmental pluripotency-associated protein 4 isoform X4 [Neovison vison]|uniref:developmental pluripotency-associated protein 4 isoform X4 n=1 Tax=Neovison vison TaxID=452646 RepID=UPI001CEFBB63|nr:developmental pluripotency-associated protein 4 isoform X4 [Neogale vison]
MEKAKGKKNSTKSGEHSLAGLSEPASEEAREKQKASGEPKLQKTSASGTKRKRSMKEDKEKKEEGSGKVRLRKKIPVPPLPSKLPPANMLHRDVLRAWCQQLKLSTKGQKLDVYKRICEYAYPDQQKNIPVTAEEAKILSESQRRSKMEQGEMSLEGFGKRMLCLPPGPELQAGLARWRPWNRHRRPTVSGGVWSMEKVFLQTQKVGFTCNSMQDKPGCLKNGEEYVPCFCYQPAIFHPHTWRTICCAPDVFGGIRC